MKKIIAIQITLLLFVSLLSYDLRNFQQILLLSELICILIFLSLFNVNNLVNKIFNILFISVQLCVIFLRFNKISRCSSYNIQTGCPVARWNHYNPQYEINITNKYCIFNMFGEERLSSVQLDWANIETYHDTALIKGSMEAANNYDEIPENLSECYYLGCSICSGFYYKINVQIRKVSAKKILL